MVTAAPLAGMGAAVTHRARLLKDERAEQIYPQDCFACRKIEEYPGKKAGFIASLLGLNIQDIKVCI